MGCDIHILFQVFDPVTKKWLLIKQSNNELMTVNDKDIAILVLLVGKDNYDDELEEYYGKTSDFWFSTTRDYILFAKIANVRNEYGLLDVLEPRGLPKDLHISVEKLFESGDYHSHTWLLDTEIEALNLDESPMYKHTSYIQLHVYENFKKEYKENHPNNELTVQYINQHTYAFEKACSAVYGFIYTVEEWESFSEERKNKERSRPPAYGKKYNNVYIESSGQEKRDYGGIDEFKNLLNKIKNTFPGQQVRALIAFDS